MSCMRALAVKLPSDGDDALNTSRSEVLSTVLYHFIVPLWYKTLPPSFAVLLKF